MKSHPQETERIEKGQGVTGAHAWIRRDRLPDLTCVAEYLSLHAPSLPSLFERNVFKRKLLNA